MKHGDKAKAKSAKAKASGKEAGSKKAGGKLHRLESREEGVNYGSSIRSLVR